MDFKQNKFLTFFRETREELKKTNWPSQEETIRYTWIVILLSVFLTILLGGIDYLFTNLANRFLL